MKKFITFAATFFLGLLFVRWASAETMQCIALTTPITRPYYATHACLNDVDWRPGNKHFATRLSYGYVDETTWKETGDLHLRTENKAGVVDNPDTPKTNETVAADPRYDNAMAVINSTNLALKKLEIVILELIQAAGGPVGKIVEVTPSTTPG